MKLRTRRSDLHASVTLYEPNDVSPSEAVRLSGINVNSANSVDLEDPIAKSSPQSGLATAPSKPILKRKASTLRAGRNSKKPSLEKHPSPENWQVVYDEIRTMRKTFTAPVDTMGCDHLGKPEKDPKNRRFATLVGLLLSPQTTDEVTFSAMQNLRAALGGVVSIESVISTSESTVQKAINKVGFWSKKSKYIKECAEILKRDFNSDIPKTIEELCLLPGVGPKIGFLCLQIAWDLNPGIGVDTHVHRITQRLGWHKSPPANPEVTRANLESWLPRDRWREINHMLVGFGQVICLPTKSPRCDECTLSVKKLCPSRQKIVTKRTGKVRTGLGAGHGEPLLQIEISQEETADTRLAVESDEKDS